MADVTAEEVARFPAKSLRERNKAVKLARIKHAAQKLFVSHGFDDTTVREIARVADVGLGTVFTYAADKRDLLFLIVNDDLEDLTNAEESSFRVGGTIEQQLKDIFHRRYAFFGQQPALSRLALREQQYYGDGRQASRFQATRARARALVQRIVQAEQQAGTLSKAIDPTLSARLIFAIYQMELREWLAREPLDIADGMALLDRSLEMLINGLRPNHGTGR